MRDILYSLKGKQGGGKKVSYNTNPISHGPLSALRLVKRGGEACWKGKERALGGVSHTVGSQFLEARSLSKT